MLPVTIVTIVGSVFIVTNVIAATTVTSALLQIILYIRNQNKKPGFSELFYCKQDLDNHMQNVQRSTGVKCHMCNKKFLNQSLLNLHKNTIKLYKWSDYGKMSKC